MFDIRRREFITFLGGAAAAWPLAARAQQSIKLVRIGYLEPGSTSVDRVYLEAFRAGLRDLGYVEGKNFVIEDRWADGNYERLPALAEELVRLNVNVIVAQASPAALAAKKATATIPIVAMSGDLLGSGLVASLNRPGGNVTGLTFFQPEVTAKRIELLREIIPQSSRVAVLFNPNNTLAPLAIQTMALTATSLKLELQQFEVRRSEEFASAFSAMNARRADAVVVVDDSLIFNSYNLVADLAMAQRLPSIALPNFPEAGGLMGYGVDWAAESRKLALFVHKIIRGATPDHLPVEQATKFKLVINLKVAKTLGIAIPSLLLSWADEVIE